MHEHGRAAARRKHGEARPRASVSESSGRPAATAWAGVALSLNGFVALKSGRYTFEEGCTQPGIRE